MLRPSSLPDSPASGAFYVPMITCGTMDDSPTPIARSDLERRFKNLVENIPGLVVYLDVVQPDDPGCSLPVYIGPQIEQLLGYPREAWLTEDELWLDVLHPDDRERMIAADIAARSALAPHFAEYRMIARDGRVVWVSEKAAVVTDELTGTVYWQGVMVDITDRKRAEEALAASERQYRSVFDAATIGSDDGRSRGQGARGEQRRRTGARSSSGVARRSEPDDRPRSRRRDPATASRRSPRAAKTDSSSSTALRAHDGSSIWCRTVMALVRDGAGRPDHLTAMVENIDGRKRVEAELVHRTIHDPLTRLPNRQHFLDRLAAARAGTLGARSRRRQSSSSTSTTSST